MPLCFWAAQTSVAALDVSGSSVCHCALAYTMSIWGDCQVPLPPTCGESLAVSSLVSPLRVKHMFVEGMGVVAHVLEGVATDQRNLTLALASLLKRQEEMLASLQQQADSIDCLSLHSNHINVERVTGV
jgi:hypothetical protein